MITINLFDNTFRHAPISTAFQESQHVTYVRDQMEWDGITVFVDGYIGDPVVDQVKSPVKTGWLHEPQCLWPHVYQSATGNLSKFDTILTYYQPFLDARPSIRLCGSQRPIPGYTFAPYGGVWIPKSEWGVHNKTRTVSMLYGSKRATTGHQMRHAVAGALGDYYGVHYYGYKGEPTDYGPQTKLKVLKPYRYSIVIEACQEDNLFTEILLDCFALGTVPIFWGAPNIDEFFDIDGILQFNTIKDLRYIMPMLSDERLYLSMLPAIKRNLEAFQQYAVCEDWLYEHVFENYV